MMAFDYREIEELERANREASLKYLNAEDNGKLSPQLFIRTMGFLDHLLIERNPAKDDELTVQTIGARLFDHGKVAHNCLISGYYQTAFMLIGDMIEVQFLLDYFRSHPEKIGEWKNASTDVRLSNFRPSLLYKELDKRDNFTGERRKKTYQQYCEYARHVSYPGMKLLSKGNVIQVGPFFDEKMLREGAKDLNLRLGHATLALATLLPVKGSGVEYTLKAAEASLEFFKEYSRIFNLPVKNLEALHESERLVEQLKYQHARQMKRRTLGGL